MQERGPEKGSSRRRGYSWRSERPPRQLLPTSATTHLRKSEENGSSDSERVRDCNLSSTNIVWVAELLWRKATIGHFKPQ